MLIKTAEFVTSFADFHKMKESQVPEFAFIGRSNVGKSSLINMLCGRKGLAKTSSKPGKTQLINIFNINDHWRLIDLPGYGYAKVSRKKRGTFSDMITDYLGLRKNLITAFVLIDSRIPPQSIDLEFIEWCAENEVPFSIVFTKIDKPKKKELTKNMADFTAALHAQGWENLPPIFTSSSEKGSGKKELLDYVEFCLKE
jgi:GTP-binding protein